MKVPFGVKSIKLVDNESRVSRKELEVISMDIIKAKDFKNYPKGTIFAEYTPHVLASDIMIKDDFCFGATTLVPIDGEVFDFDWNLNEYKDDDLFIVFEEREIMMMIKTLLRGISLIEGDEIG